MIFKIFPCASNKQPLIKNWKELASNDPTVIANWQELYNGHIAFWGVPTGARNNILVLDVDVKKGNGFQTIADNNISIPDTTKQMTLSGGCHYLYKYPNDGEKYKNRVGMLPNVDVRGDDGYIIYYGVDQTPLADAPGWLLDGIRDTFVQPSGDVVKVSPEIAQKMLEASVEEIREAPPGEANDTLNTESFKIGQLVGSQSLDYNYAYNELHSAALERGQSAYEAKHTIESGFKGGVKKPMTSPFSEPVPLMEIPPVPIPGKWTPRAFSVSDLFNTQYLKRPQLFENWSTEDIHLTTADGGTGKSTLKLMEAICLALGERFLGFECKQQGKTLFITGEDSQEKLGAMIGMIATQMGYQKDPVKLQTIAESILVKKDSDLTIISKDRQGFLTPNMDAMNKVMQAVEEFKPKMIIFDPISSFWGSEAGVNDMAKAVGKFMGELVLKSGACVEIINHMGKQSSKDKDLTQFAGRGGTGLPSNARVSRVMHPIDEERYLELTGKNLEEGESAIYCNVNKFTDGSPMLNKPFVIVRKGYLFHRITLDPIKERQEAQKATDQERILEFIKEERRAGRWPTDKLVQAALSTGTDNISLARIKRAVTLLSYDNGKSERIAVIDNPDVTNKDKAYTVYINGEEMV